MILLGWLAGCGCPSLSTLNVQDPEGVATVAELDLVRAAADQFALWSGRDSVCVDTLVMSADADPAVPDAIGAYYGPGEPVRIEVGHGTALAQVVWHELGHALNAEEQTAFAHGDAFGTRNVPENYEGAEERLDEAFARAVEQGPPPPSLMQALGDGCGVVSAADAVISDVVFPRYAEAGEIGADTAHAWSRIATVGSGVYELAPFVDDDGTAGFVGISVVAEGNGYAYTFRRYAVVETGAVPSITQTHALTYRFATGAGSAAFVRSLDGDVVVLLTEDLDSRALAVPNWASGSWTTLNLPGVLAALDVGGDVSFADDAVWWEIPDDGFGLQASGLDGTWRDIGDFGDGEASPPYARSVGGLYASVLNPARNARAAQVWDGFGWQAPVTPDGVFPMAAGDVELDVVSRRAGRIEAVTTLVSVAGEWRNAVATCGLSVTPLVIGGRWYATRLDEATLSLYALTEA